MEFHEKEYYFTILLMRGYAVILLQKTVRNKAKKLK